MDAEVFKEIEMYRNDVKKLGHYFHISIDWLQRKQRKKHIDEYLKKRGYKKIAIYGMGDFGVSLEKELKDSEIVVSYAIDKSMLQEYVDTELIIRRPEDELSDVDAIVVTAINHFDEIREALNNKFKDKCTVVSLEELIYE